MSKYAPFAEYLRAQSKDTLEITFEEFGELVGGLPSSAWDHQAWWAKAKVGDSHTWAQLWMSVGWQCISADRKRGVATFQRFEIKKPRLLPSSELRKVTAEHIRNAVQTLLQGGIVPGFSPSTDYDLIVDGGARLPPKQVFGLAATMALGFPVTPAHFIAGLNTVCFKVLEASGYQIVAKSDDFAAEVVIEDLEKNLWAEGSIKLVSHMKKERAPGLSKAKKASFIRQHGSLYCEICLLDPVEIYGVHGSACIEVHHSSTPVADMVSGHSTSLDDLQCLCANCHRIEHHRIRLGDGG